MRRQTLMVTLVGASVLMGYACSSPPPKPQSKPTKVKEPKGWDVGFDSVAGPKEDSKKKGGPEAGKADSGATAVAQKPKVAKPKAAKPKPKAARPKPKAARPKPKAAAPKPKAAPRPASPLASPPLLSGSPFAKPKKRRMSDEELAKLDFSKGCAACHGELMKGAKVHYELEADGCAECHEAVEGKPHRFELEEPDMDVCTGCHAMETPKNIHDAYEEQACLECHDVHHGEQHTPLSKGFDSSRCFNCHEREEVLESKHLHGPAAVGACSACHGAHGAPESSLLWKPTSELCLDCHDMLGERMAEAAVVHEPVSEDCTNCHNPHGTDNDYHLNMPPSELCVDCHDEIGDLAEESKFVHGALTEDRSCLNCHDPHASGVNKLLLAQPKELCLQCHYDARGELKGIGKHLEENPDHHGPIRDGACTDCHQPHGSDHKRLLVQAYPGKFYTRSYDPKQFQLCFECHEPERFKEAETDSLTGFRDGRKNLHFVHVSRERKARTCRACHDVHASKQPFHIRDSVPFGKWNLPVNFTPTPDGGRCSSGCHETREYSRGGGE